MKMNNDFREALMRAWVMGWYEGLRMGDNGGIPRNDDGKIKAADDIAPQFPALAAASALVNASAEAEQRDASIKTDDLVPRLIDASAAVCRHWDSPLLRDYVRQLENVLAEIEKGDSNVH